MFKAQWGLTYSVSDRYRIVKRISILTRPFQIIILRRIEYESLYKNDL